MDCFWNQICIAVELVSWRQVTTQTHSKWAVVRFWWRRIFKQSTTAATADNDLRNPFCNHGNRTTEFCRTPALLPQECNRTTIVRQSYENRATILRCMRPDTARHGPQDYKVLPALETYKALGMLAAASAMDRQSVCGCCMGALVEPGGKLQN